MKVPSVYSGYTLAINDLTSIGTLHVSEVGTDSVDETMSEC